MSAGAIELTGPRCSPTSEMSAPSAINKIAVNAATVNEAISARKKFMDPVTVPTWDRDTEFCNETPLTGNLVPIPNAINESSTSSAQSCNTVTASAQPSSAAHEV